MLLNPRKPKSQARQEHEDGRYLTYRPSTSPHLKYPYADCSPHTPRVILFFVRKRRRLPSLSLNSCGCVVFRYCNISSHALEPSVSQSSFSNPSIYRYGHCTSSGSWSSDSEQSIPRARHSHLLLGQSLRPKRSIHDTTLPAYSRFSTNYP